MTKFFSNKNGLITGGTGNSFMHDLDLLDPVEAVKTVVKGKTMPLDVAECKMNGHREYIFNIIGFYFCYYSIYFRFYTSRFVYFMFF